MRIIILVAAVGLGACTQGGLQSYVVPLPSEAGAKAASDITEFVNQRVKPDDGPIFVQSPIGDALVGPVLVADLQAAGYRLSDKHPAHHLRYAVSVLPDGTLLRATIDTTAAARLYRTSGNTLDAVGPFTITEQAQ